MLKLMKSLTLTLGQEFRNQLHTNFLRIEDFVNNLTKKIDDHKTTEKNAHNSEQISDKKFGTVDNGLKTINKRYDNIVVSKSSGNNILEVKDARVDVNGVVHDTLFSRLLSDGLKYGMDKEEVMTAVENAKEQVLAQEFAFDIPNQSWQYLTNLSPFTNAVMQSFHIDNKTGLIYMTQAYGDGYRISKLSSNGQVIAQMQIISGGHGTHNGYRWDEVNNKFWIYSFMKDPDGFNKMVRFTFRDNVNFTYGDYDMEEVFTGHPELPYMTPIINEELNQILYRIEYPKDEWTTRNSMNYIEIRDLDDIDAGIDNVLKTIDIPLHLTGSANPMQGVAFDHENVYWYTGDANPDIPNLLTVFSLEDGTQQYQKQADFGKEGNEFPGNFAEAEGMQMYYDKETGKRALLAGVVVGAGNYRSHKIYGIFMRDVYDKLTAQGTPVLMTETGGRTKTFPTENFVKISDIMEPGYYYMTTETTKQLTDFPLPPQMRDAGWFLEVSAPNVAGDVKQTLTRNSYARDLMIFQRMVSINKFTGFNNSTNWNHVKSNSIDGPAEAIPDHITNMNQLGIITNKRWYCDTTRSSQIKDHPNPGVAGWTVDVESVTSNAFKIVLTRVTSSAAIQKYEAYFSSNKNERITPWTLFQGSKI